MQRKRPIQKAALQKFGYHALLGALLFLLPSCASSAWREGFTDSNTLHLVGEGKYKEGMPEIQASALARHAAIMDAQSHWPRYCKTETSDEGIKQFRIENQKLRRVICDGNTCRARVIIEKQNLRAVCLPQVTADTKATDANN